MLSYFTMDSYELLGDVIHFQALTCLIISMTYKNCSAGISLKTQYLQLIVFLARYWYLFCHYDSLLLAVEKGMFIVLTLTVFYAIRITRNTYEAKHDGFRLELILVPVLAWAINLNYGLSIPEVLWAFSMYLEAVAILPQIYMIAERGQKMETPVFFYILGLLAYKCVHLCSWYYAYEDPMSFDLISTVSAVTQVTFYVHFFLLHMISGISGKTQLLFALVFTTRYLDLFTTFISIYNTFMKICFLVTSFGTLYLIYIKFKVTYDRNHDTFRIEFLLIPSVILAFAVNNGFAPLEILWAFSIYLEAVAILPQLFMISKTGEAESITSHYLFALGLYRGLYILNWIYRYFFESYYDLIAIISGIVQTILYCDFFYLYITKVLKGKGLTLPA